MAATNTPLGGSTRDANMAGGSVRYIGSFMVVSGAIVAAPAVFPVTGLATSKAPRPKRPQFTLSRLAAGIYQVKLARAYASVVFADVMCGPGNAFGNAAVPTAFPSGATSMITQDFFTATSTNLVPDTTQQSLVILTLSAPTGGSVQELASNYRCSFEICVSDSASNNG